MHNRIEKSAFRKGQYVGYYKGAWRIHKTMFGGWKWAAHSPDDSRIVYGDTLDMIGRQLDRLERA